MRKVNYLLYTIKCDTVRIYIYFKEQFQAANESMHLAPWVIR